MLELDAFEPISFSGLEACYELLQRVVNEQRVLQCIYQ